jgi:tagatose 6-phosphate kinase
MLLAVGPNPTIDRTLHVAHLTMGAVHRATKVELAAGGKGPNVTRVGHILGYPTLATGPLGGHTGRLHAELMTRDGLPADWYWLDGVETRSTSLLNHPGGDATVINEPGPTITPADWDGLARHVTHLARQGCRFLRQRAAGCAGRSAGRIGPLAGDRTTSGVRGQQRRRAGRCPGPAGRAMY